MNNNIKTMFANYDVSIIENFEIIFDRADNEKVAKERAVDYYLLLTEEMGIDIDAQEVIDTAETYGFDFSDFENLIEQNQS